MNVAPLQAGPAVGRVLITGGCGFLGSNIADALAARGCRVSTFDNLSRAGARRNADWLSRRHGDRLTVEVGDVRDERAVQSLVASADAVLHLAAQVAVTTSLDDPVQDFEVNARGTLNVLEAVRRCNPSAPVIFASTNKVYGALFDGENARRGLRRYEPADPELAGGVSEQAPLDLHSPYGCSKGTADQYVRDYARVFGLRTVVLRMSCIYGPRQFGNEDQGWIAHFLFSALSGRPITIYGDGLQVRDALFVDDAVSAWLGALDHIERVRGRIFNLGGGPRNSVSLREMLQLIAELLGRAPEVRFEPWRPGDQLWYVSDIRAISRDLGWTPRVSLSDGLRALAEWSQERPCEPAGTLAVHEVRA